MSTLSWLRGGVLLGTILSFLLVVAGAGAGNVSCPEKPLGYVSDYAEALGDIGHLEQQLDTFEKDTTNEIYVAVVDSLGGASAEDYTTTLFRKWNIGKENLDNGALFLVGVDDRQVHIKAGYGLGSVLTEETRQEIIDNEVAPSFSAGNFTTGVEKGTEAIMTAIRGDYHQSEETENGHGRWIFFVVFLLVILTVVIISISSNSERSYRRGRNYSRKK